MAVRPEIGFSDDPCTLIAENAAGSLLPRVEGFKGYASSKDIRFQKKHWKTGQNLLPKQEVKNHVIPPAAAGKRKRSSHKAPLLHIFLPSRICSNDAKRLSRTPSRKAEPKTSQGLRSYPQTKHKQHELIEMG